MDIGYLESHEWARRDGDAVLVGLSKFAAGEIGEVIHVELPATGERVERGQAVGEIESVKAVNDFYSPVTGEVVAINEALGDKPELVNEDPEGGGWFMRVRAEGDDPLAGLLSADDYAKRTAAS